MVWGLPSASMSLLSTAMVTGVSIRVVSSSSLAVVVLSASGSMVIITTASSQACGLPLSQMV